MKERLAVLALLVVCASQLGLATAMIAKRQITVASGDVFRFRCAPVDPADPFRGRYVALEFDAQHYDSVDAELVRGQRVFAAVDAGPDGFARVTALSTARPPSGAFVKCRVRWATDERTVVEFPFDRYYLDENDAPEAEELYRRLQADGSSEVWADVRVLDGFGVVEGLYVDGVPFRDHLVRETVTD